MTRINLAIVLIMLSVCSGCNAGGSFLSSVGGGAGKSSGESTTNSQDDSQQETVQQRPDEDTGSRPGTEETLPGYLTTPIANDQITIVEQNGYRITIYPGTIKDGFIDTIYDELDRSDASQTAATLSLKFRYSDGPVPPEDIKMAYFVELNGNIAFPAKEIIADPRLNPIDANEDEFCRVSKLEQIADEDFFGMTWALPVTSFTVVHQPSVFPNLQDCPDHYYEAR